MYKLLFWIIIIAGIVLYIRHQMKKSQREDQGATPPATHTTKTARCEYCGLHLPEDEAVRRDDKTFCSWEHADAWHKQSKR